MEAAVLAAMFSETKFNTIPVYAPSPADANGRAYYKECPGQPGVIIFRPPAAPGAAPVAPPPPTPAELAQQAAQQTPLPAPTVGLSPSPPIPQLVHMPMYLWIDPAQWVPQTASASAGGVSSMVTATPTRVLWDMGNGDTVSCAGPGTPYLPNLSEDQQPSDCRYTYMRSSASAPDHRFTVTTTLEWDVSWVAVGAPGGGSLGTARRSTTTAVDVAEIQTLNVPAP